MKVVLWIGNEPNQIALANKIADKFELAGVVLETKQPGGKRAKRKIWNYADKIIERLFYSNVSKTWHKLLEHYNNSYTSLPKVPVLHVQNINSSETKAFTEKLIPDVIAVSGTYLIKQPLLSLSVKIINLHTGLSPYIKGGPNCTNWCISTGVCHLIGNTIMWIDEGIDSGNLIRTECTSFDGEESLFQVHLKVMEHGHQLYLESLQNIVDGTAKSLAQSSINAGVTFYSKQWNLEAVRNLNSNLKNWKKVVNSTEYKRLQSEIVIVD